MKLAIATIGASFSPLAYVGEARPAPHLVSHEFLLLADGQLAHYVDGHLRATVPPAGLADYAETWPDCAPLVGVLAGADRVTPGETSSAKAVKKHVRKQPRTSAKKRK